MCTRDRGAPNIVVAVQVLIFGLGFGAAASMFARLRRTRGVERQQLKWFAYAVAVLAGGTMLTNVVSDAMGVGWLREVGFLPTIVGLVGWPVAVGIAILRYRLYEIDLLINRTLVYVTLTAILVLVYLGGVSVTQAIFRALTGQEHQPQFAVVVSTPVIAALFNPLRRRILFFIDRRFYRSKYDAAKTLGDLLGQAAGRDGLRRPERRPPRGGQGGDAARSCVAVVASWFCGTA